MHFSSSHILYSEEAPKDSWPRVCFPTWIEFASFCFHYFLTMAKLQYEISLLENKTSLAVQSY